MFQGQQGCFSRLAHGFLEVAFQCFGQEGLDEGMKGLCYVFYPGFCYRDYYLPTITYIRHLIKGVELYIRVFLKLSQNQWLYKVTSH